MNNVYKIDFTFESLVQLKRTHLTNCMYRHMSINELGRMRLNSNYYFLNNSNNKLSIAYLYVSVFNKNTHGFRVLPFDDRENVEMYHLKNV